MSKKRIIVIDDEPLVLKSVRMVLHCAGYAVEGVSSGPEALRRIQGESFDLVVTDWKMPYMQGDLVAREIRRRCPHLPVLLLTGSILEAPPPGFNGVLYKPFSADELREVVNALVECGSQN